MFASRLDVSSTSYLDVIVNVDPTANSGTANHLDSRTD
jgi:hypothetical protein